MPSAIVMMLLLAGEPHGASSRAALVTLGPTSPAQLDAARARAPGSLQWLDDSELRDVLEGSGRRTSQVDQVREALTLAHERLRHFDLPGVHRALDEAAAAAAHLAATPEGREVAVELRVREAELALVQKDDSAAQWALGLALSVQPELALDATRYPPALLAALDEARRTRAASTRVSLRVLTTPAGAMVSLGGTTAGTTPLVLTAMPSGPTIVSVSLEGFGPRMEPVLARDGHTVELALQPAHPADRVGPFVHTLRETAGAARRAAAEALAQVLDVDCVAVLPERATELTLYPRDASHDCFAPAAVAPEVRTSPPRRPAFRPAWVPAIAGAAGLVVGVVLLAFAKTERDAIFSGNGIATLQQLDSRVATGEALTWSGIGLLAAGLVSAAVSAYLLWPPRDGGSARVPKPSTLAPRAWW
jgi:hypothetical protein